MRAALLFLTLAACQLGAATDQLVDPGPGSGSGSDGAGPMECMVDNDCVAAGVKCCDCPTFAVPKSDPSHNACGAVPCPISQCSPNVRAACQTGACVLACA